MKKIFNLLVTLAALRALSIEDYAVGQDSPLLPIAFVNAVGLETKTDVQIDGRSLKPAGFDQGRFVEGFGLSAGNHHLVFSNGTCQPITKDIQVKAGPSPVYVLFKTVVRNPNGTTKNKLNLTVIPGQPKARGRHFLGFYASSNPTTTLRVNDSDVTVRSLQLAQLGEGALTVQTGAQPVRYRPLETANYLLVVFDGSDLHLRQAFVQMVESEP